MFLCDFGPEWVQNGPELVGHGPRHPRNTSGTLLGQIDYNTKNSENHETPTCLTTVFLLKQTSGYEGPMGLGQDPYGPGPGPLWALWARARTLMGPLGPLWARARALIMNQPYYEPASGEDDGDDGGGRIFPEHPSPILHAPRDNISRKDNPSLRYIRNIYIGIYRKCVRIYEYNGKI